MKPYSGSKNFIFVSYSRKDKDIVYPIIEKLQKKYRVWYDKGIQFGAEWASMIAQKLNEAALFVFMVTNNSLASVHCNDELAYAKESNINFINILLEDVEFPPEFKLSYGRYQMCSISDYDDEEELIENLASRSKKIAEAKYDEFDLNALNKKGFSDIKKDLEMKKTAVDGLNELAANYRKDKINAYLKKSYPDEKIICSSYDIGPTYTSFYLDNTEGFTFNNIYDSTYGLYEELKLRQEIRVGIYNKKYAYEIVNPEIEDVLLKDVLSALPDKDEAPLAFALGVNSKHEIITANFDELPHLLICGSNRVEALTFIRSILATFIVRNDPLNLKICLLSNNDVFDLDDLCLLFEDTVHCDENLRYYSAQESLGILLDNMKTRLECFKQEAVNNISEYNIKMQEVGKEKLHRLIVVVEDASLIIKENKATRDLICSLLQKGRIAGIHLIVSGSECFEEMFNGTIRAGAPSHVVFKFNPRCGNSGDWRIAEQSKVFINEPGAERLFGYGDMIISAPRVSRTSTIRLQTPYISYHDSSNLMKPFSRFPDLYSDPSDEEFDERFKAGLEKEKLKREKSESEYQDVKKWVLQQEEVSRRKIQKELNLPFERARDYFERLQNEGVVSRVHSNHGYKVIK